MKFMFPDTGGGGNPPMLRKGEEVFVLGRSHKRGYLVIDYDGQQMHLPHYYTELRVCHVVITVLSLSTLFLL